MKKGDLLEMHMVINLLLGIKGKVKYAYGLAKNEKIINQEVEPIKKAIMILDEFNKTRNELARECSEKDSHGNPIIENNSYRIPFISEFNKKHKELREKYKKEIDEVESLKAEEIKIDFFKMDMDVFPDEITPYQMKILMPLIKE